jgi:KDO2-lipid IV(A) lauroyltransferase
LNLNEDDEKITELTKKIYCQFACNVCDFLKNPIISKEKLKARIQLEGLENLKEALKENKGAIIFTAHIGNFEWGAARVAIEGIPMWGIGLLRDNKYLNPFFERLRLSKDLKTLYANRMLGVFRILKDNEVVAIPSDWDPTGKAEAYDFFSGRARIPDGPVQLALLTGAPLIPSFIKRDGKYNHHQYIGKPVDLIREGDKKDLVSINMKLIISIMEKNILENIDQWEVFHDIWV